MGAGAPAGTSGPAQAPQRPPNQPAIRQALAAATVDTPLIAPALAAIQPSPHCEDCEGEDEERVGQVEQGAELRCDESLVGRRVTVLRCDEDADGEPLAADYHPATVVAFKDSNRKNKFFIHFSTSPMLESPLKRST